MIRLPLQGCHPEPLASYLKSLAVLRLVAEQKDADARGFWKDDVFHLESGLAEDDLVHFFLDEYSPTPIVAPWNGGSGFYEGDQMEGIDAIAASSHHRFTAYRESIKLILQWNELPPRDESLFDLLRRLDAEVARKKGKASAIRNAAQAIRAATQSADAGRLTIRDMEGRSDIPKSLVRAATKARTEANKAWRTDRKHAIVQACRDRLPDRAVEWVDTAIGLSGEGNLRFPPLLGSGGNEGNLDYTNGFMRRLSTLLLGSEADAASLLRNAIFGFAASGLVSESVGQFDPGRAGGFNQGPGIEHKNVPTNPWTFVLALEGSLPWAATLVRRQGAGGSSSPFTVQTRAVGFVSASEADSAKSRPEVWAPLWRNPVSYQELRAFLSEGRAEVGGRRARNAIEFAEAAASLGVDRGVKEFVRYGLLKRRGDSYIALPAGRFSVTARSEADLVRQLEPALRRLDRFLRAFPNGEPPPQFSSAHRVIDERVHEVLARGGPGSVKSLVAALGRMEQLIAERERSRTPKLDQPLGGLRPDWLTGANDGSPEARIAAALASIGPTGKVGPLRANLSPVDPSRSYRWAEHGQQTAWLGSSLPARLAGLLTRRMMDAERLDCRRNPLASALPLHLGDVVAFLEGTVDEDLIEDLLFGFTLVDWHDREGVRAARNRLREASAAAPGDLVPRSYCLLKLLFLPVSLAIGETKVAVRPEAAIVPLLRAGRAGAACRIAQRRLFAAGLEPVSASFSDGEDGLRLAAALLLPVRNINDLRRRVLVAKEA